MINGRLIIKPDMHVIRARCPKFGTGYFTGFCNGYPYFSSGFDRQIKKYALRRNAEKMLAKIEKMPEPDPANPGHYEVVTGNDMWQWTPKRG